MAKLITAQEAAALIPSGAKLMIGGFMGCGSPHGIIRALAESDRGDFTLIADDAALPAPWCGEEDYGSGKLVRARKIRAMTGSHVGKTPMVGEQVMEGTLQLELLPMGSFVEMIRAGGAGLGAVVTPTGVGTAVEQSPYVHSKLTIDGRDYLVMRPLRAEFALIGGTKVDRAGNIWYQGTSRNFNPWMAMAADTVIVEAETLVEEGDIPPEDVVTPGVLVDYIVVREGARA